MTVGQSPELKNAVRWPWAMYQTARRHKAERVLIHKQRKPRG